MATSGELRRQLRESGEEALRELVRDRLHELDVEAARQVLHNPHVDAETLERLGMVRSLTVSYEIRRALATHPRTPRALALRLLPTLYWRDLARLASDATVHPIVRRAGERRILDRLPALALGERVSLARSAGPGLIPALRPVYETVHEGVTEMGQVEMGRAIMIVMLAAAAILLVAFRADPERAVKGGVMKGGLTAIICILGVSWMGSSFFEGNQAAIVGSISSVVEAQPWVFALGLFALSILLFSQAASIVTLVPVALALGVPVPLIVGAYPAANGNFFLPTYGTVLAAVSFDSTGTTRIGSYLLNHSFMLPGLVTTATATIVASVIARFVLG